MAIGNSGLFVLTWIDVLDATQLAINFDSETNIKCALFSNTLTPNYSTDTAYAVAPYNANEVTGTNWSAGGVVLTTTTVSESPAGTLMFDAADVSVGSATFTGARGALIYDNSLAPKAAICLVSFGADYSPVAGTFTIQWASGGIFNIDLTP